MGKYGMTMFENNKVDGRIYDVFTVVLPNGKEGK